jgi:DNA invertase Pin-like site-specific DNA recombinase
MTSGGIVAYYRVSTAKQGASGLGLEAQRATVQRYLNGGRWHIVAEFTKVESSSSRELPRGPLNETRRSPKTRGGANKTA